MRNRIIQQDVARIVEHDLPWQTFSGKTILIAGANGFLPAYLVETLLYLNELRTPAGCRVIALVRNASKAEVRFRHLLGRPDFSILVQDVCSPIVMNDKVDFIIHAASQASPKYYGKGPRWNTRGQHPGHSQSAFSGKELRRPGVFVFQ